MNGALLDSYLVRVSSQVSTECSLCIFNNINHFSCSVRAPLDKFLQLPFRVLRFKLAWIHPVKLKVHIWNETAELV